MKNNDGKYIFGKVKVGEKGQVVIPKEARDVFNIKSGDSLLMLGDEKQGIAIIKDDIFKKVINEILAVSEKNAEE